MEGRKTCSLKSCGIFHSMKISGSDWLSLFLKPIKQVLKSESLSPGFALQSTYECTTLSLQAVPHTTSSTLPDTQICWLRPLAWHFLQALGARFSNQQATYATAAGTPKQQEGLICPSCG